MTETLHLNRYASLSDDDLYGIIIAHQEFLAQDLTGEQLAQAQYNLHELEAECRRRDGSA